MSKAYEARVWPGLPHQLARALQPYSLWRCPRGYDGTFLSVIVHTFDQQYNSLTN